MSQATISLPELASSTTETWSRSSRSFRIGPWRVDVAGRELSDGTSVRRISPRAMSVLVVLVEAGGTVVSRNCLMDAVWRDVHVGDESLTQAVAELRRALDQKRSVHPYILTVQKTGYRLGVQVASADEHPKTAAVDPSDIELSLQAHLAVSRARQLRWLHGYAAIDQIKELMHEAQTSAPRSACVQAEYAMLVGCTIMHRGDRDARVRAAGDAARLAAALRPDLAKSHCAVGFASSNFGLLNECTIAFQRAFTIAPDNAEIHSLAAQAFFGLGALDTALILAERAAALDSDDILPPYIAARAARALGHVDRCETAARMCLSRADERLRLTPGSARASSIRAVALAMLGQHDDAWSQAQREGDELDFRDMVALGEIGAVEAALDHCEALVDSGWRVTGWLKNEPVYTQFRAERRYKKLARYFFDT